MSLTPYNPDPTPAEDGDKQPYTAVQRKMTAIYFPLSTDNPMFGWPEDPNSGVLESDARGRTVREISFDDRLKIGWFNAMDYFGDGSFYLLDAPGHTVGHLCALARTTPDSFVLIGADACHHPGVLRPTEYLPFPACVPSHYKVDVREMCCRGS